MKVGKGEMKFFRNGCNGGWKFLIEMGGRGGEKASNMGGGGGVGSIMGGQEILKVSLHSWQRGVNPVIL